MSFTVIIDRIKYYFTLLTSCFTGFRYESLNSDDNTEIFNKYMKLSLMEIQKEAKKLNINIKDSNNKLKNKNETLK